MHIRAMFDSDWGAVSRIFQEGLDTGLATFETELPTWSVWDASHVRVPRLVAQIEENVLGWAALTGVSDRCVYEGVAEVSIYVGQIARGTGIGKQLLRELILQAESAGYWTLEARIFSLNKASIALHEKCGFRMVGTRERLAKREGIWHDVALMERRS